ncbi:MAG: class I SAM-dependent methyltransferase [Candidatus Margulisiibacteriota bacterium]
MRYPLRNIKDPLGPAEWADVLLKGISEDSAAAMIKNRNYTEWTKSLLDNTDRSGKVMEIGSGTGVISAALAMNGRRVVLVDYCERCLDFSSRLFKHLGLQAEFILADVLKGVPLPDRYSDVVFSCGLLEHFNDDEIDKILAESSRLSNAGVISLVPNAGSLFYRIGKNKLEKEGKWVWGKETPKYSMKNYFRNAGLHGVTETSLAVNQALEFWGKDIKEVTDLVRELGQECLCQMNAGYLLFTKGEKQGNA